MTGVGRVFADIDISLDGFIAGAGASPAEPLGRRGDRLIWYGDDINDGDVDLTAAYDGVDAEVLQASADREGAVIMGRATFDVSVGVWGDKPPIRKPCFVLTSRPRPAFSAGATSFAFMASAQEALRAARAAAAGRDVGVMGGARTIRGFLAAGLLDELHLHLVPVLLGSGVRLFGGPGLDQVGLGKVQALQGRRVTHLRYEVLRAQGPCE